MIVVSQGADGVSDLLGSAPTRDEQRWSLALAHELLHLVDQINDREPSRSHFRSGCKNVLRALAWREGQSDRAEGTWGMARRPQRSAILGNGNGDGDDVMGAGESM